MEVPHGLLRRSLDGEQLLQDGSDDLDPRHVLARTGPVAQCAGLSIQVPLSGLVEKLAGVFQIIPSARAGEDVVRPRLVRWGQHDAVRLHVEAFDPFAVDRPVPGDHDLDVGDVAPVTEHPRGHRQRETGQVLAQL